MSWNTIDIPECSHVFHRLLTVSIHTTLSHHFAVTLTFIWQSWKLSVILPAVERLEVLPWYTEFATGSVAKCLTQASSRFGQTGLYLQLAHVVLNHVTVTHTGKSRSDVYNEKFTKWLRVFHCGLAGWSTVTICHMPEARICLQAGHRLCADNCSLANTANGNQYWQKTAIIVGTS